MRIIWLAGLILITLNVTGCSKVNYKPYLPEEYRGDESEPSSDIPGVFTGKGREYIIYGQ